MGVLAWFQLVTGTAMLGLWSLLLLTGRVPELAAGRRDIRFHLAAELLTAGLLILAGVAVFRELEVAPILSAFASGALVYTALNSAGYYADRDEWGAVGMFGALAGAAAGLAAWALLG